MDVIAAIMWLLLVGITIFAIISLKGGSGGTTNPSQLSPYVELVYHDLQKQLNSAGYSLRDIRELEINSLNIEITTDGVNSHGSRCYKSFFVTKFADLGFTISSWDSEYKEYLFLYWISASWLFIYRLFSVAPMDFLICNRIFPVQFLTGKGAD